MENTPDLTQAKYNYIGEGIKNAPRLDFEAATGQPGVHRKGPETVVTQGDFEARGVAGQDEDETNHDFLERLNNYIDQAEQARQRHQELKEDQQRYISDAIDVYLFSSKIRLGLLPGGNIRVNPEGGKNGYLSVGTRKPIEKQLEEMVKAAAEGNLKHATIQTRNSWIQFKGLVPVGLPRLQQGKFSINQELTQKANQIAGSKGLDIEFHPSYAKEKQALNQWRDDLQEKFKQDIGDPDSALREKEKAEARAEPLREFPGQNDDRQGENSQNGNNQEQQWEQRNTMQLQRAQKPAHQPS